MSFILLALASAVGAFLWFVVLAKPLPRPRSWPPVLRFSPALVASTILASYFLAGRGAFPSLSGEYLYGLFVVFLLPLAGVLVLVQLAVLFLPDTSRDPGFKTRTADRSEPH